MAESLLSRLGLTPEQVDLLPRKAARSLINFLLRWEAWADALACLELWRDDGYVTTMDARARALMGLGRFEEAEAVLRARMAEKPARDPQLRLGFALIRRGQVAEALTIARGITETSPAAAEGWTLLGEASLAAGALHDAERAALAWQQLAPNSRQPSILLARVALARRDPVTASAYATRALTVDESGYPPTVDQLRHLRDLFAAIPDENRLAETRATLEDLYASDLRAALALLDEAGARRSEPGGRAGEAGAEVHTAQPPALSDLAAIPVIPAEERRFAEAARTLFGFPSLRPAQAQILASSQRGENVLAILPTGGGKSLCYQLPASLDFAEERGSPPVESDSQPGPLTLVVSPLIALMKDQVDRLPRALGEQTLALNSSLEGGELQQRLRDLAGGRYCMVYAAPERLRQWPFVDVLRRRGLARLVIDEAHCVSSWGHNFRPDYLHIAQAHRDLEAPPILALTATAPTRVRQDIEQQLLGRDTAPGSPRMTVVAADSFRPNLRLSAIHCANADEKQRALLGLCHALQGSGIVYARTRALTEELAALLRSRGEDAFAFHAGMSAAERAAIQERLIAGESRILVATVAFGMGIDKPDIRFILHFGLPASLEAYYQEAGRAGRDGQTAHCVLIYAQSDRATLTSLANQNEVTVDMLRLVWSQSRKRMNGRNPGAFAMDDLVRDVQADDTQVRVAQGLLEQAGLIRRHYDVPRSLNLHLLAIPGDGEARQFVSRAGLTPARDTTWAYMELCAQTGIDPAQLEAILLAWQAEGRLRFNSSGRDVLLSIPPAPPDAQQRVAALVDRLKAVRQQQVTEIYAYARTRACRHGYLAGHLGGVARKRCQQCDNCGAGGLPDLDAGLPGEQEQRLIVLRAVQERSLGRANTTRILRGEGEVDSRYQSMAAYGALAFRSENAIGRMIDHMIEKGLLVEFEFSAGRTVLHLTSQGTAELRANRPPS